MPNAALFTASASVQLQQIDIVTALVEINRVYAPQVNVASITPLDAWVAAGASLVIVPKGSGSGICNLLFAQNKDTTNFLTVTFGFNGAAGVVGEGLALGPGAAFLFFDPSGTNYLSNVNLSNSVGASGPIPVTVVAADING